MKNKFLFLIVLAHGGVAHALPIPVGVYLNERVHPISPLIFGVAFGDPARNKLMGYTVDRWGGNSTTRYNWQADVHNTANDYYFQNIVDGNGIGLPSGSTADQFIGKAFSAGAVPLLTIPTIGYTPHALRQKQWGFSVAKYGAQLKNECDEPNSAIYCTADSGNGECDPALNNTGYCIAHAGGNPAGYIIGNDASDTSITALPNFEAQWIAHLQSTFAANGGVKFYALDNELMLWNSTHRDVHPNPVGYGDAWTETSNYALAIKTQEPDAVVTGPVTWGYPDLFTSAKDAADCNCLDGTDRTAHNHVPFVAWYLQQVCANPSPGGKYLVDYLDLHYYPQDPNGASGAIYSNAEDPATVGRRLRSLRELYDASWTSESWIGTLDGAAGDDPTWHYTKPNLIPRVRAWIKQYCPDTKLAITEYAWDKDTTSSGAVAQAELLAIFAREGVDLATRWTAPGSGTKVEDAFSLFLNYDGAGSKVQGDSVWAASTNVDQIGAYAFRLYGQRSMVLLTNKDAVSHDVTLTFSSAQSGAWTLYGFDATHGLQLITSGVISGTVLSLTGLPSISASLLVIPDSDGIFKDGFGG